MNSNSRAGAKNRTQGDPADELRRRARRRLVGAVVLFLFALVVVPALIQPGPQTPSDPIELVIPKRSSSNGADEDSKASSAAPQTNDPLVLPPKANSSVMHSSEPKPSEINSSSSSLANSAAVKPSDSTLEKPPQKSNDKTAEKLPKIEKNLDKTTVKKPSAVENDDPIGRFADETMGQKNLARAQAQAELSTQPTTASSAPSSTTNKTKHWVQVAAVGDNDRARALRDQLASKGFNARVEATQSSGTTIYRVRVGPFANVEKADETKSSLSKLGFQGRVVQ